ncbi:hypothetical protein QHI69_20410 [Burkholderia gladioli pv. gladioli]|uniref:hypothetical protein n=1 Tax=Burkholderia gladioli TaxID=28095 RepID=UPI000FDAF138|nr:hypothetical protein [Burkholderia gladioli]MDJ1164246.1 hypothetical protein [Burkholderia gladioli pv. gladioli]QPQ84133.1 hypothetical protein I6H08_03350 [Burkholderia gladioli]
MRVEISAELVLGKRARLHVHIHFRGSPLQEKLFQGKPFLVLTLEKMFAASRVPSSRASAVGDRHAALLLRVSAAR